MTAHANCSEQFRELKPTRDELKEREKEMQAKNRQLKCPKVKQTKKYIVRSKSGRKKEDKWRQVQIGYEGG